MSAIPLESGMRVRCVDAGTNYSIRTGDEYRIERVRKSVGEMLLKLVDRPVEYRARRFKPIIRVKAPSRRIPML